MTSNAHARERQQAIEMEFPRRKKDFCCGHCGQIMGRTTFYQHRRLYFDRRSNQWLKHRINFDSGPDSSQLPTQNSESTVFTLSDSDEHEDCVFHMSSDEPESNDEGTHLLALVLHAHAEVLIHTCL